MVPHASGKMKAIFFGGGSMVLMGGPLYRTPVAKPFIVGSISVVGMFLDILARVQYLTAAWPALTGGPTENSSGPGN